MRRSPRQPNISDSRVIEAIRRAAQRAGDDPDEAEAQTRKACAHLTQQIAPILQHASQITQQARQQWRRRPTPPQQRRRPGRIAVRTRRTTRRAARNKSPSGEPGEPPPARSRPPGARR